MSTTHPDREALLAASNGEITGISLVLLERHLDGCETCRSQVHEFRREWASYLEFHDTHLKAALPAPPTPWEDLRERMTPSRAGATSARWTAMRWVGIAAAATVAILAAWQYLKHPPAVSAAELLGRAVAAAPAPNKTRRIVLRTKRQTLVRAAVSTAPASEPERALRAYFDAANYSWADPLSAQSFQAWRRGLDAPVDHVDEIPAAEGGGEALYRISTSTESGALRHATLSLRQADLAPVSTHLEFQGETVDISHIANSDAPAPTERRNTSPPVEAPLPEAPPPGLADEVRVVAALHSIGADLGEPVVIERTRDAIQVSLFGLPPERMTEIRTALEPFPYVRVDTADSRPRPKPPGPSANPATDRILEWSDTILSRAFAARALATRFPASSEEGLDPASRALLRTMVVDHGQALENALAQLSAELPPRVPAAPGPAAADWRQSTERVLEAARRLDQILNRSFASRGEGKMEDVTEALGQLRAVAAADKPHWSGR